MESVITEECERENDDEDEREGGQISLRLWKIYCTTLGKGTTFIALMTFLLAELTSVLANIVLSQWTAAGAQQHPKQSLQEIFLSAPLSSTFYLHFSSSMESIHG